MTMRAKRYQNFAALLIFMRHTTISHRQTTAQRDISCCTFVFP